MQRLVVISKSKAKQDVLKMLFGVSFPNVKVILLSNINEFNEVQTASGDVVVYDTSENGPLEISYIRNSSCGWLNIGHFADDRSQLLSLNDGFNGMVSSEHNLDQLPTVIRCIQKGQFWYSRQVLAQAIRDYQSERVTSYAHAKEVLDDLSLTERERQLALHLLKGRSNKELAELLCISIHTVKTHVSRILRKLGLKSRAELQPFLNAKK